MNIKLACEEFPSFTKVSPNDLYKSKKSSEPITPEMLVGIDARAERCRLDGQLQTDDSKHSVIICYDRSYAVSKLHNQLKLVIDNISLDDWLTFMTEVYNHENE
jgi:hypothetical protein